MPPIPRNTMTKDQCFGRNGVAFGFYQPTFEVNVIETFGVEIFISQAVKTRIFIGFVFPRTDNAVW